MGNKVIIIAAPNDFAGNVNVSHFTLPLVPALGAVALGSYLAAHDVPVELIDVQMDFGFGLTLATEQTVSQRVAQYLQAQADDIAWIGISQLSNAGSGVALAQEIHAALPNVPIILGGYFPSSNYQFLLENHAFITAIVRGDGEEAALAISRALAAGEPFLTASIPNLAWRDQGQVRANPIQQVDLSSLPILNFGLLQHPNSYYHAGIITSRGCPQQCRYCLERSMRPAYAPYSLDWIERQLDHLESVLVRADRVFIYDPIFGVRREHTLQIAETLARHRLRYGAECRVDSPWLPDAIPELRDSGLELVFWGIESASPDTLLRMGKVRTQAQAERYVELALAVLEACFANDVTCILSLMLGFPGDTEEDYQASLAFTHQVRQTYARVAGRVTPDRGPGYMLFPVVTKVYAGTPLAQEVGLEATGPFVGETVLLDDDMAALVQVYQTSITEKAALTPVAVERLLHHGAFSMQAFLADHPDLVDDRGVVRLGDRLHRLTVDYVVGYGLLKLDKARRSDAANHDE
ncbi:MAG: B12-binding domain-containing radical SAM protein [Chloroflexi bacterium]|nr:B12-binding domain-containing radical SAM protein [Chloroflexota bacterium]